MTATRSRRSVADEIQKIVEDLAETDERLSSSGERPSRLTDKVLASTLVLSQLHHVDYVGSNGSVPALVEDIQRSSIHRQPRANPEILARHLAKCGWYVDQTVTFDSVSPWVDDPDHPTTHERAGLLEEALRRVKEDHWSSLNDSMVGLPYYLIDAGVTHPDFRDPGVDPTGALDRALGDAGFYGARRCYGFVDVYGDWSYWMAEQGWTVDLKTRPKKG